MKISIIIPLHNAEQYIETTLKSITQQKISNIEVLIINDCSTDKSIDIIENFISNYSGNIQFLLLHNTQNIGPGQSRNIGIKQATGEYIYFMDADDMLPSNALEKMETIIQQLPVEAVITNHGFIAPDDLNPQNIQSSPKHPLIPTGEYKGNKLILSQKTFLPGTPWAKLISRKFLLKNNLFFSKAYRGEDSNWWKICLFCFNDIYILNEPLYFYRKGHYSLMKENNQEVYLYEQETLNLIHSYTFIKQRFMANYYHTNIYYDFEKERTHLVKKLFALSTSSKYEYFLNIYNLHFNKWIEFLYGCPKIKDKINNLYLLFPPKMGFTIAKIIASIKL